MDRYGIGQETLERAARVLVSDMRTRAGLEPLTETDPVDRWLRQPPAGPSMTLGQLVQLYVAAQHDDRT